MNRISSDNKLLKYFSSENLVLISKLENLNFKAKKKSLLKQQQQSQVQMQSQITAERSYQYVYKQ